MKIKWSTWRTTLVALLWSVPVATFFALHVLHFAHRNDADRVIGTPLPFLQSFELPFWQSLEALEYRLYDARFSARGAVLPKSHDKIAIVGIDESSLINLNETPWPFPREYHAQLIRRLKKAGA